MPDSPLHAPVLAWYAAHARDLPWRASDVSPWGVLVSEVMLAQTPVARVLPVYREWIRRWPTPAALAAEQPGDVIRAWGTLGYPRRALRLHEAAGEIVRRHAGRVPRDPAALRALPGVGAYTAAAVAAFAYAGREAVLDTNVRRVLARALDGTAQPAQSVTVSERTQATSLLPGNGRLAARWSVALMELGALVCTARRPRCELCPIREACRWHASGSPAPAGPPRPVQRWAGTDRQCRGRLLAVLRDSAGPVPRPRLERVWDDVAQRERALDGLVADGLVEPLGGGRYALPRSGSAVAHHASLATAPSGPDAQQA